MVNYKYLRESLFVPVPVPAFLLSQVPSGVATLYLSYLTEGKGLVSCLCTICAADIMDCIVYICVYLGGTLGR